VTIGAEQLRAGQKHNARVGSGAQKRLDELGVHDADSGDQVQTRVHRRFARCDECAIDDLEPRHAVPGAALLQPFELADFVLVVGDNQLARFHVRHAVACAEVA
jgi:hypothetical protein